MEIKKCKKCEKTPEIHWSGNSGTNVIAGTFYQTVIIDCEKCLRSVDITFDGDSDEERRKSNMIVVESWNKMLTE